MPARHNLTSAASLLGQYSLEYPLLYCPLGGRAERIEHLQSCLSISCRHMQVGAVTCIDFSPLYPYNYAATSSTRVIIFDARTRRPLTTLSRFKDRAYSGTFRSDGKLLVAGGETGFVQVRRLSIFMQRSDGCQTNALELHPDQSRCARQAHQHALQHL